MPSKRKRSWLPGARSKGAKSNKGMHSFKSMVKGSRAGYGYKSAYKRGKR